MFTPQFIPGFDWGIDHVDGNDLYLAPFALQSPVPDTIGDYVLNGIPQLRLEATASVPVAAEWIKPLLKLTYAGAVNINSGMTLPSADQAWRGPFGSSAFQKFMLEVIPEDNTVLAVGVGIGVITMQVSATPGQLYLNGTDAWTSPEMGGTVQTMQIVGDLITTTWDIDPVSGDTIVVPVSVNTWLNATGGVLTPGIYNVP